MFHTTCKPCHISLHLANVISVLQGSQRKGSHKQNVIQQRWCPLPWKQPYLNTQFLKSLEEKGIDSTYEKYMKKKYRHTSLNMIQLHLPSLFLPLEGRRDPGCSPIQYTFSILITKLYQINRTIINKKLSSENMYYIQKTIIQQGTYQWKT